ncbi:MAG: hypothetical protein ACI85E_001664 [Marinomonas primoryensis]|jgi:hypothetical protein
MIPHQVLKLGEKYSKKDLAALLDQPNLSSVREGIFHCKNSASSLAFVDLEKKGKDQRLHYDDFFEEDYFHWDSQTTQHIGSPKIREIVSGSRTTYLFSRISPKVKNITQPFVYCGRLVYSKYEEGTANPVHIIFQNVDYDDYTENEDLIDVYLWNPATIGKTTKSKISQKGVISPDRIRRYKQPNETERIGLVTSRVGQGYYRQQILEKWDGKCPISGINIKSILISSHIVPWSECTDEERLDVDNGILLSPNFDSLFDRHLITFNDDGLIQISPSISREDREALRLFDSIQVPISNGMGPYLKRHREKFQGKVK